MNLRRTYNMNTKLGELIVELYNSGILLKYDGNLTMDKKIGGLKPTNEYNQLVLSFTENDYVSVVIDDKYRLLSHSSESGEFITMEYFPDIFGFNMLLEDIGGLLDDMYTSLGFIEFKKYVWRKKQEYVSDIEHIESSYVFRYENDLIGLNILFVQIETKDGFMYASEKLEKYLFTEKEIDELLPNSKHMFDKFEYDVSKYGEVTIYQKVENVQSTPKVKLDSLYGEIKGTEV